MDKATFPLNEKMRGAKVGILHAALAALGLAVPEAERSRQYFGAATKAAVVEFQKKHRLKPTGAVDEATAAAFNAAPGETATALTAAAAQARAASGRVLRAGLPVKGARVRAFQETEGGAVRLGEDITDAEGRYTIRYDSLPGVTAVNLRVAVEDEEGRPVGEPKVIAGAQALEIVDLIAPAAGKPAKQPVLKGNIITENGLPLPKGTRVGVYRRDFGGKETLAGQGVIGDQGSYELAYDAEAKSAGLEVCILDKAGQKGTPLSNPLYDLSGGDENVVNLVAPAALVPLEPEYNRLEAAVKPYVGNDIKNLANSREDAERQDLTTLNRQTGWDARLIALAATAARLSADSQVGLSPEVLYGLFRAGLPSEKTQLACAGVEAMGQALGAAKDAGIISLTDLQLKDVTTRFEVFAYEMRLAMRAPGSRSTYRDFLEVSGLGQGARDKFAAFYLGYQGDGDGFWKEAVGAGISVDAVKVFRQQGKLAYLTLNNAALTSRLQKEKAIDDPAQLVENDFYRADAWAAEVRALAGNDEQKLASLIPLAFEGETVEERLNMYAGDMARKVRLSYPTQVLARTVEQDTDDKFKLGAACADTARLLKNAAARGFRFGRNPVKTLWNGDPDIWAGVNPENVDAARKNVEVLGRVYQITPSDEAMAALLGLGLTSAYDVTAIPRDAFFRRYGKEFSSPDEAELVYRKSRQVSAVVYNLFTIAKTLDSTPPVYAVSAPGAVREAAKVTLAARFPTMESLFGSLDFCECEDCRSVLSPAAYFVNLLQFLDTEDALWNNTLAAWRETHGGEEYTSTYTKPYDVLSARRPDLEHIQLTCENTHTALPYIDVVNEILEYYVAHNSTLAAEAAHDTGEATTAELLAEPQHVLPAAYKALSEARYPLALPFDLWLETVRRFGEYFEMPLWRLLEAFRPSDELFAPTQAYDRAALFAEYLELSPAEYALFTDPQMLDTWNELYGFDTADEATSKAWDGNTGQRIDVHSAKALSRRLGITYKELAAVLRTGFVNPKLETLGVLYKLGVTVADALFYKQNQGLLSKAEPELTPQELDRREELRAFVKRLDDLSVEFQAVGFDARAWLDDALAANEFDDILVLADPDTGCSFDETTFRYASDREADGIAFLKVNLFVRLWRKLGWTIEETDRALQTLTPKNTPFDEGHLAQAPLKSTLLYMAHLKALEKCVCVGKHGRLKLLALWAPLATTGENSLYAQLFLSRSILKRDPVFDDPLGDYLSERNLVARAQGGAYEAIAENVDPSAKVDDAAFAGYDGLIISYDNAKRVQRLSYKGVLSDETKGQLSALSPSPWLPGLLNAVQAQAQAFLRIKGHMPALQGALGLTADDIARILEDAGASPEAELSLATVSLLYRYGLLARGLNLSIRELIALKGLSALDPFKSVRESPPVNIDEDYPFAQTLRFVEVVEQVKNSGLGIEDLEYLLRHRWDDVGKYRPKEAADLALIRKLAEGVRGIRAEYAVPDAPGVIDEGILRQKLGLALPPDVAGRFFMLLHNPKGFSDGDVRSFFETYLQKQAPGVEPAYGFLDEDDYELLFGPLPEECDEGQRQKHENDRRMCLARAFLPWLEQREVRRFIIQTLTAETGGETALVEALLTDSRLLGGPEPLLAAFPGAGVCGLTATFFASGDGSGAPLASLPLAHADTALKDGEGNPLKPAGANSARFDGYLEVPASGVYRFYVSLEKKNAKAEFRFGDNAAPLLQGEAAEDGVAISECRELKAGVLYRFVFAVRNLGGGEARLLVQGETLPKGNLAQLKLYSLTAAEGVKRGLVLLRKTLQIVEALGLTERELRYLLTHGADFGGIDLAKLPTGAEEAPPEEAKALFDAFLRLARYARLKREMAGGTDDLIDVFAAPELDAVYAAIAQITRREAATVKEAAEAVFAAPVFRDDLALERLWEALRAVERLGVSAAAVAGWTRIVSTIATSDQRFTITRDLKKNLKARLETETWQRVAQPIFDELRRRQRDALVAYIMHRHHFARSEQLFEYFLIDPGMEPVVQTSRIRLAIASVQIFIQRCLLNLETEVHPSVIDAQQWEWVKRYRVWEANRKIWLFPENWLEPEFRDDKTHLFAELEGTLLQGDVSQDLVEDAFLNYLKKLEELARLDIAAMYCEDDPDPASNKLHVIGRSYGEPHKYFYRRYANQMWTPWEPITVEIEGDHLAPVVWRDRLYLFWVTFLEKAGPEATPHVESVSSKAAPAGYGYGKQLGEVSASAKSVTEMTLSEAVSGLQALAATKTVKAQLHWSEYLSGQWSARQAGGLGAALEAHIPFDADVTSAFIHVSKVYEDGEERGVKVHLGPPFSRAFYLAGRNSVPASTSYEHAPGMPYTNNGTLANRYTGSGGFQVTLTQTITTEDHKAPVAAAHTLNILAGGYSEPNSYTLLPTDNAITLGTPEIASLVTPVFYQDNTERTLFVEPTLTEKTIEQWEEWVTPGLGGHPEGDRPGGKLPGGGKNIILLPAIPAGEVKAPVGIGEYLPANGGGLYEVNPAWDWLVNPVTVVDFDGELVGPAGRTALAVQAAAETADIYAAAGTPISASTGGAEAPANKVVATANNALARAGLQEAAGGLNVIGAGGLDSATVKKLETSFRVGLGAGKAGGGEVRR